MGFSGSVVPRSRKNDGWAQQLPVRDRLVRQDNVPQLEEDRLDLAKIASLIRRKEFLARLGQHGRTIDDMPRNRLAVSNHPALDFSAVLCFGFAGRIA
jgi:hypothetical protein